ncbi:hypothetical protein EHE19_009620 [Ruminiclostridium herbifermentans]|uniref:DUF6603 domain-containing protein n=1 Tax=Ruminiclostridium herbifermentans TaxID=2488810 RepID=A0A4U7JKI2_9FIRM|nr:DUF6603 domain-containing protein [Ruminiclostridium herbifermentans]QNU68626.1 hypothetical protein EHE19_009620 [Ruminiclostridium herbifermentans]
MQDKTQSVFEKAILEMHKVLLPLLHIDSKYSANKLINKLGYVFDEAEEIGSSFSSIASNVEKLPQAATEAIQASSTADKIVKIAFLAEKVTEIVKNILSLKESILRVYSNAVKNTETLLNIAEELPRRLLDYLLCTYLSSNHTKLYSILNLVGITTTVEENYISLTGEKTSEKVKISRVSWQYVSMVFSDPAAIIRQEYNWKQGENIYFQLLFERVLQIMRAYLLPGGIYTQDKQITASLTGMQTDELVKELRIPLLQAGNWPDTYSEAGISISPIVKNSISDGMAILPYIFGEVQAKSDISDSLQLELNANGGLDNGLGIILRPACNIEFISDLFKNPLESVDFNLKLKISQKETTSNEIVLLGYADSSKLSINKLGIILFGENKDNVQDFGIEFEIGEILLVIKTGDGDGFIQKLLPNITIEQGFSIKLGFSINKGFYIKSGTGSGGGLEYSIYLNKEIGPLLLDILKFKLKFNNDKINLIASISGGASMGPLSISITDIGIQTWLKLGKSGLLGGADIGFGFKPPDGFGLAVKTSLVSGGGFLQIDVDKGRYFGALQLKVKNISLAAIGLLDTKDSEGKPLGGGFSLLIIICAEIPPIQLGYGFSLMGIGGLLGLNRTVDIDELRDGVRNKALDNIMFPADPVGNANQLVQSLSKIFPPKEDCFLIAPMVRIGWGVPTPILKLDLSILVELPSFDKIAILGRMKLALPSETDAVISIQLDSVGIVSFEKGMVSIDAVLYDSYIAKIMISGEMALRANWKGNPDFVLSIGGFHPAFTPPIGFPDLKRLTLSIDFCKDARLRMESYFALTTNSIQFGSHVDFYAKVGCFSAEGMLAFDTLIYFNPFGLSVDFKSSVSIKCSGKSICAVTLAAHLSGPRPWHIKGQAKFSLLCVSHTFNVDFTIGSARPAELPKPVNVEEILEREIVYIQNWSAQPPDGLSIISLKEAADSKEGEIRVHPLGGLKFVQTRVPLDFELELFGSSSVEGNNLFNISSITVGNSSTSYSFRKIQSAFAPAQFMVMSESEKLTSPAFENYDSGVEIDFDCVDYDEQFDITDFEYETIFADNKDAEPAKKVHMSSEEITAAAPSGPAGLANLKNKELKYFKEPELLIKTKRYSYSVIEAYDNKKESETNNLQITSSQITNSFSKATQIKRASVKKAHILTVMEG